MKLNSYTPPVTVDKMECLKSGDLVAIALAVSGVEERDGLIWKELLVVGEWPGNEHIPPLMITPGMLAQVVEAFNAKAIAHVDVPIGHTDDVTRNTGFVEGMEIRGSDSSTSLWVGIRFTEPEIDAMVRNGTIANVSAFLQIGFTDPISGVTWPLVLWHVALTNKPVLKQLEPFVATHVEGLSLSLFRQESSMQGPKDGGQQAAGNADKSPSGLITLSQADLDRIKADERAKIEGEVQAQLAELKKNGEEAHQIILSQGATLHRSNVRQIVLAMQGRGEHEFVKMPAGFSLPPAVVAKVEEYLSADVGANKGIKLSIGGESKDMSVSDICLAIVGAVIESKVGLVSLAPHGVTESEKPGGAQLSQDAVDKDIDAYLVKRNLVTVPASK